MGILNTRSSLSNFEKLHSDNNDVCELILPFHTDAKFASFASEIWGEIGTGGLSVVKTLS